METKQTINRRLAMYSAVAVAVVASGNANATIQSNASSLTLPLNMTAAGFDLDFNNDGTTDISFGFSTKLYGAYNTTVEEKTYSFTTASSSSSSLVYTWYVVKNTDVNAYYATVDAGGNAVMVSTGSSSIFASGLDPVTGANLNITSSKNWAVGSKKLGGGSWSTVTANWYYPYITYQTTQGTDFTSKKGIPGTSTSGNFMGTAKYLGVKFDISGNTHYGWARVQVVSKTLLLLAYGYEDVATYGIAAGETVATGIDGNSTSKSDIYSFGRTIHVNAAKNGARVNVYDVLGKEVYAGTLKNGSNKIALRGSKGMHVVKVGNTNKKVFIN